MSVCVGMSVGVGMSSAELSSASACAGLNGAALTVFVGEKENPRVLLIHTKRAAKPATTARLASDAPTITTAETAPAAGDKQDSDLEEKE
jgi:hypothetical protein